MSILVNPQWLMARIDSNRAPVILDVRWYRDHLGGYDHYLEPVSYTHLRAHET